jgi:hypothetical protein
MRGWCGAAHKSSNNKVVNSTTSSSSTLIVEDLPQSFDFSRGLADMRVKDATRFQRHITAT